jgi:PAS domain S-box-containing protein
MIEETKITPTEIALQARVAALEQQLIEQQKATSRLLDASREGLWDFELKPDGAYFISPRTAELLGYTISGLPTPFDFRRHVYAEDWPHVRGELEAALKGLKEYAEADFRAVKPNGETTWVRIRGITVPQRNERDGRDAQPATRPIRFIGSVLDISREHLAEQNLAAQKQLFANVFSVLPIAAFIVDANSNILEVNPAWETLMQAAPGSAIGAHTSTFGLQAIATAAPVPPVHFAPAFDSGLNAINAKPTLQWQTIATTAIGGRVSVMIRKAQIYAGSGEVIGAIGVITDLTARELAQRELMREREQLSLVVKSSGAGLFTWSQADGKLHLSNRAREMLGWGEEAQSIRPSDFMQAVHAEDESETRKKISRAFNACSLFEKELRLRCGDGQYRWYYACGQFTAESADEPKRYIGSLLDIAERKHAVDSLALERQNLQLVLNASNIATYSRDYVSDTMHVSPEFTTMLGYTNADFTPASIMADAMIHPEDLPAILKLREQNKEPNTPLSATLRLKHKNGQFIWIETHWRRMYDKFGKITHSVGAIRDISAQKLMVDSLELERLNLKLVLDATKIATYYRDFDSNHLHVSPEFSAVFGYSVDFFESKPLAQELLIHPDDIAYVHAHRDQFADSDEVSTLVTRARHSDGHYIWIESYVKRIRDKSGKITRSVGALRDISEQKQRELQLLEANQRAEAATKIKSEFLATMSHEIRTPLNGVIGAANLLAETKLAPEQREYVNAVRLSGDTLLALLGDVLDLSKIESGAFDLDEAPISLLRLVDEAAEILGERARAKRVNIIVTVADDIPSTLKGDAVRVRQVVLNLLSNAIKFTTLGDITVTVMLEHQFASNHCEIRFTVTDSGIGMSEAVLARLFTPFTQADSSTSRRFGGTGLGLAICKGLIERMGGKITVTSKEGVGSAFSVVLPFAMDEHNAVENVTIRMFTIPFLNKRVMLVEPHAALRAAISARLKRLSIVVEPCATGAEALELLNNGSQTHAIITEIHLPDMDAGAFAFAVRRITGSNGRPIKLVALTNTSRYQMERDAATRLREFDAYLLKPARDAQLAEALASVWGVRPHHDAGDSGAASGAGSGAQQRLKVLIVDDNQINQMLCKQTLLRLGHEVAMAENGEDAVTLVNKHAPSQPFDLILMDLQMPVMDGFEAAALITAQQPENRRPTIVALSANVSENDRVRAAASGMVEFLSKPLSQDRLRYVLRSVLNKDARLKSPLSGSVANTQNNVTSTPLVRSSATAAITVPAIPISLNIPVGPNLAARRYDDVSTQPLKVAMAPAFERTAPLPIISNTAPFTPQNTTERLRAFTPEQLALDPEQLEEIAFIAQHGEPSALATIVENLSTVSTEALTVFTNYGNDLNALSKAAHRVGGAYATVGAKQAHAAFKALENAARGNVTGDIPKLLQDALEKREIAHRAFIAWYANIVRPEK